MKPDFVEIELKNNPNLEWFDEHDFLKINSTNPFDKKNQIDWWKKNNEIRNAFRLIELEIKGIKRNKTKINKSVISWSKLADLAKCDRQTLRHPKRERWTKERFNIIIEDIEKYNESLKASTLVDSNQKSDTSNEDKVHKARNETITWMNKYYLAEQELKTLKRVLKHKDNIIFSNESKIKLLRKQIDNLVGGE